jgi:hypothetical protein
LKKPLDLQQAALLKLLDRTPSKPSVATNIPTPAFGRVGVKEERETTPPTDAPPLFDSPSAEPVDPFDPDSVFNRQPSPQMNSQDEPASTDRFIREVVKLQDSNIFEAGVASSLKILESLKEKFSHYTASKDA